MSFIGKDKTMHIKLKPILYNGIIDLCAEFAAADQLYCVQTRLSAVGRFCTMSSAVAASAYFAVSI